MFIKKNMKYSVLKKERAVAYVSIYIAKLRGPCCVFTKYILQ